MLYGRLVQILGMGVVVGIDPRALTTRKWDMRLRVVGSFLSVLIVRSMVMRWAIVLRFMGIPKVGLMERVGVVVVVWAVVVVYLIPMPLLALFKLIFAHFILFFLL